MGFVPLSLTLRLEYAVLLFDQRRSSGHEAANVVLHHRSIELELREGKPVGVSSLSQRQERVSQQSGV